MTYQLRNKDGKLIGGSWCPQELLKTQFPNTYLVEKILQRGTGQRMGQVLCKLAGKSDKDGE